MLKWRHFHRESKQKDHVYGIPEKGRYSPCLAPPTRHEWCFLGNRARGWPWKKLLHSSFWEPTSPKEKGRFLVLSAPALENHLESRGLCGHHCWEEEGKLHFSRILALQAWAGTVHPRPGLPTLSLLPHSPFSLGGVRVLSSLRALTHSLGPDRSLNVKRNSSACLRFDPRSGN